MHTLVMHIADGDGSLLRVLSTAWRRGWQPEGLTFNKGHLRLTVRGSRSVDLLQRQLQRLTDVRTVEVLP